MTLELRPYQRDALDKMAEAEARGVRAQMGVAATGLGKTVMFTTLARERGGRSLILAHRDELIEQAVASVRQAWPEVDVGVVKAERNEVDAQVVVASVQTLARPNRLDALLDPGLSLLDRDPFDLVVVDEAHHAAADSYRAIIDRLGAGAKCPECGGSGTVYEDHGIAWAQVDIGTPVEPLSCPACMGRLPLLLGVTATPDRGDGEGLDDIFDEVVWSYDILWGIRAGFLADVRGLRVTLPRLDLGSIKKSHGDYQAGDAGRVLLDCDAPRLIVEAWSEHAADRRTLVFMPTVAATEAVAAEFVGAGVRATWVSGDLDVDERRTRLASYADGETQVMVNCMVLTEGYDNPRTDCVVIGRPTRSRALYTQMVGRGTRRHPDKTDLLVLDVVGATEEHSLVTIPSLFGVPSDFEGRDKLGDGSGLVTGILDEYDDLQVRLGKMRAEQAEMFRKMRGEGIAWVHIDAARYLVSMGEAGVVRLEADPDVDEMAWRSWVEPKDSPPRVLIDGVGQETAQGVAEDYIRVHGPRGLVDANAGWRGAEPSPKQLRFASSLGIEGYRQMTKGELSDAITAALERKKAAKSAPPDPELEGAGEQWGF